MKVGIQRFVDMAIAMAPINFYVKVTERSLQVTLRLFVEVELSKLGHGGLLVC